MVNKLIQKLQEEDLFAPPTEAEIAHRNANRPPRVLGIDDEEGYATLCMTLCDVTLDLGRTELMELLMTGKSSIRLGIERMSRDQVIKELIEWVPAYIHNRERNADKEKEICDMMHKYIGEKYDSIEGFPRG